jgi:hypothetical protein
MTNGPTLLNLSEMTPAELRAVAEYQGSVIVDLEGQVAALNEEIARLKGLKGRPDIKPSGLDKGTDTSSAGSETGDKKRRGGAGKRSKREALAIDTTRIVKIDAPEGSRFKGYRDSVIQDLIIHRNNLLLRRQVWETPDGTVLVAAMPDDVRGQFGANLHRLVVNLYYDGQSTMPRIHRFLTMVGVEISTGQIEAILNQHTDDLRSEAEAVLRAGLETSPYVSTDDTGARHGGQNAVCTEIGGPFFTVFITTFSKSRINFLELLRGGYNDYRINAAALAYLKDKGGTPELIERVAASGERQFKDEAAFCAHITGLGITSAGHRRLVTESGLAGSIAWHDFLKDAVILSDGAPQFDVFLHALCWVHGERHIHRLHCVTDEQSRKVERMRTLVWAYYADLKRYRMAPTTQRAATLRRRFDRIFNRRTGFADLDQVLERLFFAKDDLLRVLDRPEIPLNTNTDESQIRAFVTKRKVSGGTRSDLGRQTRDAVLGLLKTCTKLKIAFWDYLGDRFGITPGTVPPLAEIIRSRTEEHKHTILRPAPA